MNNSVLGFTFQKLICDKYKCKTNERIENVFKATYSENLKNALLPIIEEIFGKYGFNPVECTTFSIDEKENKIPYNFILDDNSTLSIRTNLSSDKVAPRELGQAGYAKLNEYFNHIYGKSIESQDDIKKLICSKIDKVMPIFIKRLFDADYILWIYLDKKTGKYSYELIKGNSLIEMEFEKKYFTFTRGLDDWVESTTLKYNKLSIAEIQVHKNRTFKLRFIMKSLLKLIKEKERNNETLGITAEKATCDLFGLEYPMNIFNRASEELQYEISDILESAFEYLPAPKMYTGNQQGERGGNSKCPYDFILDGDKTLSLKTNIGKKVCPPEVGQPSDSTCYLYFKHLTKESHIDQTIFKKMVFENIDKMVVIYLDHLFDSDYLLRVYETKNRAGGSLYEYQIYFKNEGKKFLWRKEKFSFSKRTIQDWNVSNTVYYDGIALGEFEIHKTRNCYKFRFYFDNLIEILRK